MPALFIWSTNTKTEEEENIVSAIASQAMNLELEQQQPPNSKSSPEREGEGAENLKMTSWAALERLPTRSRIRRGILLAHDQDQENREIDVKQLGPIETNKLLERLVKINNADHQDNNINDGATSSFLLKFKDRMDR